MARSEINLDGGEISIIKALGLSSGEMLGEDDWFDKMAGIGRDHVRFNHMLQLHKFTDQKKREILAG